MALDTKLTLVTSDKDGKRITLQDTTGVYNATDNTGGYGAPNPEVSDIQAIRIYVESFMSNKLENYITYTPSSFDPTIVEITDGDEFLITPDQFDPEKLKFPDGVLDVSMLTLLANVPINAFSGTKTITSAGLFPVGCEGLLIDDVAYMLDKSKANTTSTLYLVKALLKDATVSTPFFHAITRAFVYGDADCCVVKMIGRMVDGTCSNEESDTAMKLFGFLTASKTSYNIKDYQKANTLIQRINQTCSSLNCKC